MILNKKDISFKQNRYVLSTSSQNRTPGHMQTEHDPLWIIVVTSICMPNEFALITEPIKKLAVHVVSVIRTGNTIGMTNVPGLCLYEWNRPCLRNAILLRINVYWYSYCVASAAIDSGVTYLFVFEEACWRNCMLDTVIIYMCGWSVLRKRHRLHDPVGWHRQERHVSNCLKSRLLNESRCTLCGHHALCLCYSSSSWPLLWVQRS